MSIARHIVRVVCVAGILAVGTASTAAYSTEYWVTYGLLMVFMLGLLIT